MDGYASWPAGKETPSNQRICELASGHRDTVNQRVSLSILTPHDPSISAPHRPSYSPAHSQRTIGNSGSTTLAPSSAHARRTSLGGLPSPPHESAYVTGDPHPPTAPGSVDVCHTSTLGSVGSAEPAACGGSGTGDSSAPLPSYVTGRAPALA
eukprot:356355-Chlamydomonas_euryale.AAC.4